MKCLVIYSSDTGNTAAMAEAVLEGAKGAGLDASEVNANSISAADALAADCLALGSPSMGVEELHDDMQALFTEIEGSLGGKKIVLFGSYDWGDGQWMRDWEDRVRATGANLVAEGLIVQLTPDATGLEQCKVLGAKLA